MAKQEQKVNDDDGRVICNMDVEGMRWHDRRARREQQEGRSAQGEQLTQSETWIFTWHAVLAALTIVMVFAVTWVLFILFCTQVWFR